MNTIFLSFDGRWYLPLRDGKKKYEHRKRFCNEPVRAFVYIGKPIQAIVAEIGLGKRENLESWREEYKNDKDVLERIEDVMHRNKYGMKVLWFNEIVPIELKDILTVFPDFVVPRSYIILDKKPGLLKWLDENKRYAFNRYKNDYSKFSKDDICVY